MGARGGCVCSALCVTWSLPPGPCFRGKGPCPVLVAVQPVHSRHRACRQRQRLAELWAQGHQGAGAARGGEARPPDRGHHSGEPGRGQGAVFKPSAETDRAGAFRSCAALCNREAQGSTPNHSPPFSVAGSGGDEAAFPATCGGYPAAPRKAPERADMRGGGGGYPFYHHYFLHLPATRCDCWSGHLHQGTKREAAREPEGLQSCRPEPLNQRQQLDSSRWGKAHL